MKPMNIKGKGHRNMRSVDKWNQSGWRTEPHRGGRRKSKTEAVVNARRSRNKTARQEGKRSTEET